VADRTLEGLALISRPLGENDRLLTLLSEAEGLTRLAVPGARRPRSSLAAAVPFALLQLQVGGGRGLQRVRQLRVEATTPISFGEPQAQHSQARP
jgi:DNA repair protein RecO (recombination protein O)